MIKMIAGQKLRFSQSIAIQVLIPMVVIGLLALASMLVSLLVTLNTQHDAEAINMAGCGYPGHTELLADLTNAKESGMMIIGGPLRIMFVTTHVAIKDLPSLLTRAKSKRRSGWRSWR